MSRYHISDRARFDLDEIWLFIAKDNQVAADRLVDSLVQKFPILASTPGIGRLRIELGPSLRGFPVGKYIIFYRAAATSIEIIRVLHGARDIPSLFE